MTTMTKSEFARHINVKPGYITQLNNAGRLVMDGDKVMVEESVKRIADTRDPSKTGVAARHEKARQESASAALSASAINPVPGASNRSPSAAEAHTGEEIDNAASGSAYQRAKAVREKYNALMAKSAYEREIKQLLSADEVRQAVMDGDTIIRSRLESLPDQLAPQLAAEMDEQRVRAILIEQIEYLLTDLSSSFNKLVTN